MDETEPLLSARSLSDEDVTKGQDDAFNTVEFNSDTDPDNPWNWPESYKWGVILLLAFMAFTVYVLNLHTLHANNSLNLES
jgi:hypothetical protein